MITEAGKLCVFDLEGPLSTIDFAAEICRFLGERLGRKDFDLLFKMISEYDDVLVENPRILKRVGIEDYEPGDSLRLLAPLYAYYFTHEELIKLSKENIGLVPGAADTIKYLRKNNWPIYVISTSYEEFAFNVTDALKIPRKNVFCTAFPITELRKQSKILKKSIRMLVDDILGKFKKEGFESILEDLNSFFWENTDDPYSKLMNQISVRGGERKALTLNKVCTETHCLHINVIAVGDSITDRNMLLAVKESEGIAISFNGNKYSVPNANVAVTSPNLMGISVIIDKYPHVWSTIEKWSESFATFKDAPDAIPDDLLSKELKTYFIRHGFAPQIDDLRELSPEQRFKIIQDQQRMRERVRGWVGELG
ncbi:MAG: hypothetical protein ACFE7E_03765 [Candidatus Hodarchaeota archaeon]